MADPISIVEDHIIDHIQTSPGVLDAVKAANIISFNESIDPRDDVVSENDVPNTVLISSALTTHLSFTSNTVEITKQYALEVNSGSWNVSEVLNPLMFALTASYTDLLYSDELRALTWNGKRFVLDVELQPGQIGISDLVDNKGIDGWSEVTNVLVTMFFTRADLIAFNKGTL